MNIAIIQFPGSNCERETAMAVQRSGMNAVPVLWNADATSLEQYDGFIIVGGFSYEDRSRSGVIAAKQPIIQALKKQAALGKPVLGICNGAQILIESGLVPDQNALLGCLTNNMTQHNGVEQLLGFYNDWVHLTTKQALPHHAFLNQAELHKPYYIPMANAEGRFVFPKAVAEKIKANGSNVYYCDASGDTESAAVVNPNSSTDNLAAVSNIHGNVMAIMPHPERCEDGQFIFDSMREYIKQNLYQAKNDKPLASIAWTEAFKTKPTQNQHTFIVKSHINDNTADTINMLLKQNGLNAELSHHRYWTFNCDHDLAQENKAIHQSGEFYNSNKESLIPLKDHLKNNDRICILTQSSYSKKRDDLQAKLHKLFGCDALHNIEDGKVWEIAGNSEQRNQALNYLLSENIILNPVEHQAMFLTTDADHDLLQNINRVDLTEQASTDPTPETLTDILYQGKVRSLQNEDDHLLMTTHDRTSAFDRHICDIKHKGMLLNLLNSWWLDQTSHIIANHKLKVNQPNQMHIHNLTPIPLEIVVRGFICGNTQTSLWTQYKEGVRQIDDTILPEGMQEYDPLPTPIITPTVKAKDHDTPITEKEIIAQGILTEQQWQFIKDKAIKLFTFGQMVALSKGLILADTKYEFGFDQQHNIVLMDECHTPDSSRFWLAESYHANSTPKPLGKDTLRQWLKAHFNPYEDKQLPDISEQFLQQLSQEYYQVYARLTGDWQLNHFHFDNANFSNLQQGIASCVA